MSLPVVGAGSHIGNLTLPGNLRSYWRADSRSRRTAMRHTIVRVGTTCLIIGATLLLGTMGIAFGRHALNAGVSPLATPEGRPEPNPATFSIFGLVESPGRYDWSAGMTVGRAVAAAGGYADGGSPDELQIQRMVEGRLVSRAVTEDDAVRPEDVIMVRGRAVERPDDDDRNRSPGVQTSRSSSSRSTTCSTFSTSSPSTPNSYAQEATRSFRSSFRRICT